MTQPATALPTRLAALENIANLAYRVVEKAYPLQEQFNPETFEVTGATIMALSKALSDEAQIPEPDSGSLLARLAALLETVALNPGMVDAAQGHKWRAVIEAMIEIVRRVEAIDQQSANRTATLVEALEKQDVEIAVLRARIAELEAHAAVTTDELAACDQDTTHLIRLIEAMYARVDALEAWKETQMGEGE